jgi:hypothetical protein
MILKLSCLAPPYIDVKKTNQTIVKTNPQQNQTNGVLTVGSRTFNTAGMMII